MENEICITGGSGFVGSFLGNFLTDNGYEISVLTRSKLTSSPYKSYTWDTRNLEIDPLALKGKGHIIHLSGAGVADNRWTKSRKIEIRDSRVNSTRLLYNTLKGMKQKPSSFISASAIGVYGHDTGVVWVNESREKPGDDFLATVTREWEEEVRKIGELGIRVVILRIGIVLSANGGALAKLIKPLKMGLGAPLGSGDQYMSWIDINDLASMFQFAIENKEINGVYNAVSPEPVTNKEFTSELALKLNKRLFLPSVPGFLLRMIMGEMASIVLGGNRVSSEKIQKAGFTFNFPDLETSFSKMLS